MSECINCHKAVGGESKVFPMTVAESGEDSTPEVWCPQCFAYVRAPQEADRWQGATAVQCLMPGCQQQSVSPNGRSCAACRGTVTVVLPPVQPES